jgi:hypothetical protein
MPKRAALILLLAVLPLTLGLRAANRGESLIDEDRLAADSMRLLASQGWETRPIRHHVLGPLVEARQGDCRILMHFASPSGASIEKFKALARAYGPVSYRNGEKISSAMPRGAALLAWHGQRYARGFGVEIPTQPVIAEARAPACGEARIDLSPLRQRLKSASPS